MTYIDASQISENLWQGSLPPTGSELQNKGYTLLILCAEEYQFRGEDFLFPGVRIIRAPNRDDQHGPAPTREELEIAILAAKEVADEVLRGGKALVTCASGMNRSGLVTALALHILYGWPGKRCVQQVRKERGGVVLRPQCYPLSNEGFVLALYSIRERPPLIPGR